MDKSKSVIVERTVERYFGYASYIAKKIYKELPEAVRGGGRYDDKGRPRGIIEEDDLIEEGLKGLLEAWDRFDEKRGIKPSTFFYWRIRGAILDYLRREDPLPYKLRKQLGEVDRAREELRQGLGREPTAEELAYALNATEKELEELERRRVEIVSFEETESEIVEFPENSPSSLGDKVEKSKLIEDLKRCLKNLNEGLRLVLILRETGWTLKEVGQMLEWLGISDKSKISREHNNAKAIMKDCLEGKGWQVQDILHI
jgi:RNA polymerase sigma factor for flagellar operon FliA